MDDLERQLAEQRVQDRKHGHEKVYSRFIVVEGLFINTADICPLPKIVSYNCWCFKILKFFHNHRLN